MPSIVKKSGASGRGFIPKENGWYEWRFPETPTQRKHDTILMYATPNGWFYTPTDDQSCGDSVMLSVEVYGPIEKT